MKKKLKISIILFFFWFLGHLVFITADGLEDELGQSDIAVVLGNKVEEDGKPSLRLKARLDKAVELYQKNWFKKILVSGAVGKEGFD